MRVIALFLLTIFFQLVLFVLAVNCFVYTDQNNNFINNISTLEFSLVAFPFIGIFLGSLLFWERNSFRKKGLVFLNNFQRAILIVVISCNFSSFLFLLISFTNPYIGFYFPFINIFFFLALFIPLLALLKVRPENQKGLDAHFFKRALVFDLILAAAFALVMSAYGLTSGNLSAMFKDFQSNKSRVTTEKSFENVSPYKIGGAGLTIGVPNGWIAKKTNQPIVEVNQLGLKQKRIITFESPDKKRRVIVSGATEDTRRQDIVKLIERVGAELRSVSIASGELAYEIGQFHGNTLDYSYFLKNKAGTIIEVLITNASNNPLLYEKWVSNINVD